MPPGDLPAIGHLAERGGVERRRHLRVDGLDRRQNRDLRPLHAKRHREIDRVLADVDLVLQRRRDVDRGVGDDEDLVIGRHVHDEHVTEAAAGAEARLPRHDRAEQLVGVQAALHQQLRLAAADQLDRRRRRPRGCAAASTICVLPEIEAARLRDLADLRGGPDEDRRDQSASRRPRARRPAPFPRRDARRPSARARGRGIVRAAARTFRFRLRGP